MNFGRGANRTFLRRPSQAMFKLAIEAVTTGRIPPALRQAAPLKALVAIAFVFFLEELMKSGIDTNRTDEATLAKHHQRAWQRAETLLAEAKVPGPSGNLPTTH